MKKEQENFTFRMSIDLREKLQVIADDKEITLASLVRIVLKDYLKQC